MSTSCLVCCEQSQYWILPPCNHKEICWKCCLKLVEGSIFSCPFCKSKPESKSQLLFVSTEEMNSSNYNSIMQNNPFRSYKNTVYFYSNSEVGRFIEAETSFHCTKCGEVHQTLNLLKKHLNHDHRLQYCEVCLDNRKCITAEQTLYNDYELQRHLREGQLSKTGEVMLYHPLCEFCNRRFYDLETFKIHLKMSAHMKCEICDINCQHLKFIYYRNFNDLEQHHRKTHFVCDLGDCASKKLENVFVSEGLLEDHKRRCHRKHRSDKPERAQNILLGFNKKEDEEFIQFDGIGRDFSREFSVFDAHEVVQKEEHVDEQIDIREFYPDQLKMNMRVRIQDIADKIADLQNIYGGKSREPELNFIPIFKPLAMSTLFRSDCEKLLKKCFSWKEADGILEIFFAKRMDYRSPHELHQALERKLRSISPFAFFLIFPQLIRNLNDKNKGKVLMDKFYGQKLRGLKVNRRFIFHEISHYSELIEYTKGEVQKEVIKRLQSKQIDLELYANFLKNMNMNFYVQKQELIYWVSKQKITHLYHMIQHCATNNLLKMNWLLKVGLSQQSYELIRRFFYLTPEEKPARPFSQLSLQELSLLKSYLTICLQAILDPGNFTASKLHPQAHFLTSLVDEQSSYPSVSTRQINQLKLLEGRSDNLIQKHTIRPLKGVIISQSDCPSLLAPIDLTKTEKQKPKEPEEFVLPRKTLPAQWNEEQSRKKKEKIKIKEAQHDEQFPALFGNSKKAPNKKQAEEEEQFPVFNFKDKFVSVKAEDKESVNINLIGFNNKYLSHSHWDEEKTRKNMVIEEKKQKKQQKFKKKEKEKFMTPMPEEAEEDPYLKLAIQQSLKTAKIEEEYRKEVKEQKFQILVSKKGRRQEDEEIEIKLKKNKKNKNKDALIPEPEVKKEKEETTLFERIQMEEKLERKEKEQKKGRQPFRLDLSEQKKQPKVEEKKKLQKILGNSNRPILLDDDFQSLTQNPKQEVSIVNKIIKQSQAQEEVNTSSVQRHKGKKRRRRGEPSP